jgi:phage baseplate assembly protein W
MKIVKNIFSDIPFFFSKNTFTSDVNLKKDGNCIRQSIKNIVLSRFGEKPFDFNFGSSIYDLLFDNIDNNDVRVTVYKIQLQSVINTYEPRALVKEVNFSLNKSDPRVVDIEIVYENTSTGAEQTLVVSIERTR